MAARVGAWLRVAGRSRPSGRTPGLCLFVMHRAVGCSASLLKGNAWMAWSFGAGEECILLL